MPATMTTTHVNVIPAYTDGLRMGNTDNTLVDSSGGTPGLTLASTLGIYTVSFYFQLAHIADGDMLTSYAPSHAFKILAVNWRTQKAATTASKATTLNLEIGTTDLTGGVVALTSANCTPAGAAVAGSAVTDNNTGVTASSFSIEASSTTAFVEGTGWLLVRIQNMDTVNAIASLAALISGSDL